jgi:hypothetical protein
MRFRMSYEYGKMHSNLTLVDLKFPSIKRGIAAGYTQENSKVKGIALLTSDGGQTWTSEVLPQIPLSLFFLDDSIGWMVTEKAIWKTVESGRNWQKLHSTPKETLRVLFLNEQHGWAIGLHKHMSVTDDGGASWTAVPEASTAPGTPEFTTFGSIGFGNQNDGVVTGWSAPPAGGDGVPDWADPVHAKWKSDLPMMSIFLETRNGGKTWRSTAASLFGRMTRTSLGSDKSALALIEFSDRFEWPAEVYRFDLTSGKPTRVFRAKNRVISDVLLLGGTGFLAGYEAEGEVRRSPIPGPVKVLISRDMVNWDEIPVDYRAEAHRCILAGPDAEHVFVATDTGMILRLEAAAR